MACLAPVVHAAGGPATEQGPRRRARAGPDPGVRMTGEAADHCLPACLSAAGHAGADGRRGDVILVVVEDPGSGGGFSRLRGGDLAYTLRLRIIFLAPYWKGNCAVFAQQSRRTP